ncbi:MAG TPA: hypothetical protein VK665_06380 [Candidatus Elarobacter sp.]|nr:hypothetical protein [Candidatus Elarobacter sp.]
MTIMAAHFGITLGVWRLRLRIDIDEPRESELAEQPQQPRAAAPEAGSAAYVAPAHGTTWGRG